VTKKLGNRDGISYSVRTARIKFETSVGTGRNDDISRMSESATTRSGSLNARTGFDELQDRRGRSS
jgi:hypothetical protein